MTTTHYIWDEENDSYFMETDGDGNVTAVYTNEPVPYGRVISQRRGNATSFYHYDGQGSTRQLTDENGNVTDEYTYSAFGETVASSGATVNPFRYQGVHGYYCDSEISILYVRSRHYACSIARWLSADPAWSMLAGSDYVYSYNSPLTRTDPAGLLSWETSDTTIYGPPIWVLPDITQPCGGFNWPTKFKLTFDEEDGLIIQRVCFTGTVTMCNPKQPCNPPGGSRCANRGGCLGQSSLPGSFNYCYFEVWRVYEHFIYISAIFDKRMDGKQHTDEIDDVFFFPGCEAPCTNRTRGNVTITGDAAFIPIHSLDRYDRGWRDILGKIFDTGRNGVRSACSLFSACEEKRGAKDLHTKLLGRATGKTSKRAVRKWDCCGECDPGACRTGTFVATIGDKTDVDVPDSVVDD